MPASLWEETTDCKNQGRFGWKLKKHPQAVGSPASPCCLLQHLRGKALCRSSWDSRGQDSHSCFATEFLCDWPPLSIFFMYPAAVWVKLRGVAFVVLVREWKDLWGACTLCSWTYICFLCLHTLPPKCLWGLIHACTFSSNIAAGCNMSHFVSHGLFVWVLHQLEWESISFVCFLIYICKKHLFFSLFPYFCHYLMLVCLKTSYTYEAQDTVVHFIL